MKKFYALLFSGVILFGHITPAFAVTIDTDFVTSVESTNSSEISALNESLTQKMEYLDTEENRENNQSDQLDIEESTSENEESNVNVEGSIESYTDENKFGEAEEKTAIESRAVHNYKWGDIPYAIEYTAEMFITEEIYRIEKFILYADVTMTPGDVASAPWKIYSTLNSKYSMGFGGTMTIEVVGTGLKLPVNSANLFADLGGVLSTYNIKGNLDGSDTENMTDLFRDSTISFENCTLTSPKATTMATMFYGVSADSSIIDILKNLDTKNVTNMSAMFRYSKLSNTAIGAVSNFNMSKVTRIDYMLSAMTSISSLDLNKWDLSSLTVMTSLFSDSSNLVSVKVDQWNTSNVENYVAMFENTKLQSINLENWDTSKKAGATSNMFAGVSTLKSVTLGDNFTFSTSNGVPVPFIEAGDQNGWNPDGTWIKEDGSTSRYTPESFSTSYGSGELTAGTYVAATSYYGTWGTAKWKFDQPKSELTIHQGVLGTYEEATSTFKNQISLFKTLNLVGKVKLPENSKNLFSNFPELAIVVGELDTSNAVDMTRMFYSYQDPTVGSLQNNLKSVDVSNWDLSKVEKITEIFRDSKNLTNLDVKNWDTSNIKDFNYAFSGLVSLKELDVASWDVSSAESINGLFRDCSSLSELNLENWDTSNVVSMTETFSGCSSLESLNVANWDTSSLTIMQAIFSDMLALRELDLSNWDTSGVRDMFNEFLNLKLESLTLGEKVHFDVWGGMHPYLGEPVARYGTSTGKWIKDDWSSKAYSPEDFMSSYGNTSDLTPGTYVAEIDPESMNLWGTCPWVFLENTGELKIFGGNLGIDSESPWNIGVLDPYKIKKITFIDKVSAPENSNYLFSSIDSEIHLKNLNEFEGIENMDTSGVTTMVSMFSGLQSLKYLDIQTFNTSKVTNMQTLFYGMSTLEQLVLDGIDTSKVTNMSYTFMNVLNLKTIDLSSFDTSNVTTMNSMFSGMDLDEITLGNKFIFVSTPNPNLKSPSSGNGKWTKIGGTSKGYSAEEFIKLYGSNDLQAGTYVGEKNQVTAESLMFDTTTIGQTTSLSLKIDIDLYDSTLENGLLLQIDYTEIKDLIDFEESVNIESYDNENNKISDFSVTPEVSDQFIHVFLKKEDIQTSKTLVLNFSATAWNNTTGIQKKNLILRYPSRGGIDFIDDVYSLNLESDFEILNGSLQIVSIPDDWNFGDVEFKKGLQGLDMTEGNYGVTIDDFRGTNPVSDDAADILRENWQLVISATPFHDGLGNDLEDTVTLNLLSKPGPIIMNVPIIGTEVILYDNNTENEVPRQDYRTEFKLLSTAEMLESSDPNSTFGAINVRMLGNSSDITPEQKYTSTVTYELRQAP